MKRRSVIHVLLSLLLLLSQQMAAAHAMSHFSGKLGNTPASLAQQQTDRLDLSGSFAQDPSCDECLAFAQLSGTLGSDTRNAIAEANAGCHVEHRSNRAAVERTTCHFRSRAPPVPA
ncbi:hypothetical protein [Massilia glaciei]|uniref:DUF2946 domain-containing protein n=1 Tax=Massilia glaciei TaxID=1524097 RepID=A0A2U2I7P0_9BURK|nr:hypothetical protein [Massilia glaciei]PWF55735.1 hypothetical protein C7C56_000260 [Massilia glaciei]